MFIVIITEQTHNVSHSLIISYLFHTRLSYKDCLRVKNGGYRTKNVWVLFFFELK